MIVGVILAAGESSRMGDVKQALPFRASTVLGTVVETALESALDGVVVVTGYHTDIVEAVVPDDVRTVRNPDPARGNHSSLMVGLAAAGDADAVVMLLGDQPQVDVETVDRMVAAWHELEPWAAVADYRGEPGHPFLFSRACIIEMAGWTGPRPLWRYLVTDPAPGVVRVGVDRDPPIDVDTPEDYAKLIG